MLCRPQRALAGVVAPFLTARSIPMNPLKTVAGTIISGFVLAVIIALIL